MQEDRGKVDHAPGWIDVSGLRYCDLLAAQRLSDDVEAAGERSVAELLRGVRAVIVDSPHHRFLGIGEFSLGFCERRCDRGDVLTGPMHGWPPSRRDRS